MAKTVKADLVGIEKDSLIRQIDKIRVEIHEQANKIPTHVLFGDSVISAAWRERAEELRFSRPYAKIANRRKSVDELKQILFEEQALMESITTNIKPTLKHKDTAGQLDIFE